MPTNKRKPKPTFGQEFFDYYIKFERVSACYEKVSKVLHEKFAFAEALFPIKGVFFRAIKDEEILEMWGQTENGTYTLIEEYKFAAMCGTLGPKRKEMDNQLPEGFYFIERYNPLSIHHLSVGINYPNLSDRVLGDKSEPGSDIFIHGGRVTVGCIPVTDELMEEIFIASMMAQANGQQKVYVHIFPSRLSGIQFDALCERFGDNELTEFWSNLKIGFDIFEKTKIPPVPEIDKVTGKYIFR